LWSVVWRSGFVGLRLTFVFRLNFVYAGSAGFGFFDMSANVVSLSDVATVLGTAFGRFERSGFLRTATRFARQDFDGRSRFTADLRSGCVTVAAVAGIVSVAMLVVVQIFKNITDIEEGVAVEANVHESRLHTGKDAGDFTFIDAADEGEFLFALDVNLD
jgi:hypothetical protein